MPRGIFNYYDYKERLEQYAELCGVTIRYHTPDWSDGWYYSRIVSLANDLEQKEEIAVLLHELGHFIDHQANPKFYASKRLEGAYVKFNASLPLTRHQKALILVSERRAWKKGMGLAKQLRIPLGKYFYTEMRLGLDSYLTAPTCR